MTQMRTIEIDFDVHKCIENERHSFEEHPNLALRRLLKLPPPQNGALSSSNSNLNGARAWTEDGVNLSHGTPIRMLYDRKRQIHEGRIDDGKLAIAGFKFDSLSGAASELAVTKKGKKTRLNGWLYFEFFDAKAKKWVPLMGLRKRNRSSLALEELGL